MYIYSVFDPEFKPYGKVLEGYDTKELCAEMDKIVLPSAGTKYEAGIASLEKCKIFDELQTRAYGDMPIQLGMCWGRNTKLNCLEYHRDSEINIGTEDFILLLAKMDDIGDGWQLNTDKVKAFKVPAGAVVEVYATTLHYAPCNAKKSGYFRVAVALPDGTNLYKPEIEVRNSEDKLLWARNKWLLAHPDSKEAGRGAFVGLYGNNINIEEDLK